MRYKKILLPLQKEQNIHHHCIRIIYKENFFIEFRYNPSDVTFKKITPPAKSIQHVSTINQEICKNVILVFYPPLLETSRSSHLTRTLSDSIIVKPSSEIPRLVIKKPDAESVEWEGILVVENSYRAAFVPENRHKTRYRV